MQILPFWSSRLALNSAREDQSSTEKYFNPKQLSIQRRSDLTLGTRLVSTVCLSAGEYTLHKVQSHCTSSIMNWKATPSSSIPAHKPSELGLYTLDHTRVAFYAVPPTSIILLRAQYPHFTPNQLHAFCRSLCWGGSAKAPKVNARHYGLFFIKNLTSEQLLNIAHKISHLQHKVRRQAENTLADTQMSLFHWIDKYSFGLCRPCTFDNENTTCR